MFFTRRNLVYGLALAAAASFSAAQVNAADASIDSNVVLTAASASASAADPGCCAPCKKCAPRCICYKHHPTLFKTCRCCCCKTKTVVLQVYDPCCCCCVDVPVCIPDCCAGCVSSRSRGGLVARNVSNYRWSNGYRVRIVMGPRGNIDVHSYGR